MLSNINKARATALVANKIKREKYLANLYRQNLHLKHALKNKNIAKIALTALYISEGSKNPKGVLTFGNSNPLIINLFLKLLRLIYNIDDNKFRCTLQCRADQDIRQLEQFWSDLTKIPLNKFYKVQIDPRTVGKKTRKKDYKGVCRINYFSADIYNELFVIEKIIS